MGKDRLVYTTDTETAKKKAMTIKRPSPAAIAAMHKMAPKEEEDD